MRNEYDFSNVRKNPYTNKLTEINEDPFYSAENIAELERRVESIRNGTSTLKEHKLIEEDDE